jgi:hypothetical protein
MTGFFPIMMFALPAAALAIWHEARPEQRKVVGGIMASVALTAFFTGITEPLEFAFVFVAWPLYLIHALLTGPRSRWSTRWASTTASRSRPARWTTSINFGQATRPLLAHPDRLGYAAVLLRGVPVRHPALEPAHARAASWRTTPRPPRPRARVAQGRLSAGIRRSDTPCRT